MFGQVDCHQSVNNLVEDDQSEVGSTLQETAPTKICKHGCHGSLPAVVIANIPGAGVTNRRSSGTPTYRLKLD